MRLLLLLLLTAPALGATITGSILQPDGTPYAGSVAFIPLSHPIVVGEDVVGAFTNRVTTAADGGFTNTLAAGDYDVQAGVTRKFRVTVPDGTSSYLLTDLITTNAYWGTNVTGAIRVNGSGVVTPSNFWLANSNAVNAVVNVPSVVVGEAPNSVVTLGTNANGGGLRGESQGGGPYFLGAFGQGGEWGIQDASGNTITNTDDQPSIVLNRASADALYVRQTNGYAVFTPLASDPTFPSLATPVLVPRTNDAGVGVIKTKSRSGNLSDVAAALDVPAYVADLTALAALSGDPVKAVVADTNAGGLFTYTTDARTANGATIVTATGKGSGRWVRSDPGVADIRWFGGKPNDGVSDLSALQAAVAAGYTSIKFPAVHGESIYDMTAYTPTTDLKLIGDGPLSVLRGLSSTSHVFLQWSGKSLTCQDLTFRRWYESFYWQYTGANGAFGTVGNITFTRINWDDCTMAMQFNTTGGTLPDTGTLVQQFKIEDSVMSNPTYLVGYACVLSALRIQNLAISRNTVDGYVAGLYLGMGDIATELCEDVLQSSLVNDNCIRNLVYGSATHSKAIFILSKNMSVRGNSIINVTNCSGANGIEFRLARGDISDNTFIDAGETPLVGKNYPGAGISIFRNRFETVNGPQPNNIIVLDGCDTTRLAGNMFKNIAATNSPINWAFSGTGGIGVTELSVKDSIFVGDVTNSYLVYVQASTGGQYPTNIIISGNTVLGGHASALASVVVGTNRIDNIEVTDNSVESNLPTDNSSGYAVHGCTQIALVSATTSGRIKNLKLVGNRIARNGILLTVNSPARVQELTLARNVTPTTDRTYGVSGLTYCDRVRFIDNVMPSAWNNSIWTSTASPEGVRGAAIGDALLSPVGAWIKTYEETQSLRNAVDFAGGNWVLSGTNYASIWPPGNSYIRWTNVVGLTMPNNNYVWQTNFLADLVANAQYRLRWDNLYSYGRPRLFVTEGLDRVYELPIVYNGEMYVRGPSTFARGTTAFKVAFYSTNATDSVRLGNLSLIRVDTGWGRALAENTNGTISRLNGITLQAGSGAPSSTGTVASVYQNLTGNAATALAVNTDGTTTGWRYSDLQSHSDQTITGVVSTIAPTGRLIRLAAGASYTLTSTPTITAGNIGQIVILTMYDSAGTVVLQDAGTLTGSTLELGASSRSITGAATLTLIYDGAVWKEIGYSSN